MIDEVNALLDAARGGMYHNHQLRESVQSIAANIREAYGRRAGPERNQFLRFANGSAEETDEHLRSNYKGQKLASGPYWRLHNRLVTIMKMLDGMQR